ncbi:hypothetical protein [Terrimesophilobacter mesophilus]|uniref:Uncharacterized protein n=1 Tax=Terrimesophilobacter mesophilus TaxID=433647 RepID=A0A4R8VDI4_9MICO|nr:hypothetical protein [Terrimesophilobacter mesophilus]TFB79897.1 hypothetical protein E3N84_07470 [Terrimesophilobacter mesophilus]
MATLVLVSVLGLTSCANGVSHDHSGARAELNPQLSQIVLPLEAFAMNWSEAQTINQANATLTSQCMGKKGLSFPRAGQDWASVPPIPERRYGLWSRMDAENNGYELPQSAESKLIESQENSFGDDWWQAFHSCFNTERQLPLMAVNSSPNQTVVDRGINESFEALLASPEFKAERGKWSSCIESDGLALNPDARVLVPQFPPAGEEQLKVAALDVACKEKLNTVQILADWETRNQLDYIDAHEAELKAYRDSVDKVLAEAKKVITTVAG